jgi:hypothetical protein
MKKSKSPIKIIYYFSGIYAMLQRIFLVITDLGGVTFLLEL